MMGRFALLLIVVIMLFGSADSTHAEEGSPRQSSLSLQGGWWSVEAEFKSRWGIYAALGVPYPTLMLAASSRWVIPFGVRVGYQYELSRAWKLRAAAHLAGSVNSEDPCGCREYETEIFSYQFVELGLRYESSSGFVAGLDLPILAFKNGHDLYRARFDDLRSYPGPAFTQAYFGYAWHW